MPQIPGKFGGSIEMSVDNWKNLERRRVVFSYVDQSDLNAVKLLRIVHILTVKPTWSPS